MISRAEIDKVHNDLVQSTEQLLVALKARQEQQRIEEEEAERLRKLREEQVRVVGCTILCFSKVYWATSSKCLFRSPSNSTHSAAIAIVIDHISISMGGATARRPEEWSVTILSPYTCVQTLIITFPILTVYVLVHH